MRLRSDFNCTVLAQRFHSDCTAHAKRFRDYFAVFAQISRSDCESMTKGSETTRIQQIVGVFLYYARVLDLTMLCRITQPSSMQANATEAVRDEVNTFPVLRYIPFR
jgi:hypothetical protein